MMCTTCTLRTRLGIRGFTYPRTCQRAESFWHFYHGICPGTGWLVQLLPDQQLSECIHIVSYTCIFWAAILVVSSRVILACETLVNFRMQEKLAPVHVNIRLWFEIRVPLANARVLLVNVIAFIRLWLQLQGCGRHPSNHVTLFFLAVYAWERLKHRWKSQESLWASMEWTQSLSGPYACLTCGKSTFMGLQCAWCVALAGMEAWIYFQLYSAEDARSHHCIMQNTMAHSP